MICGRIYAERITSRNRRRGFTEAPIRLTVEDQVRLRAAAVALLLGVEPAKDRDEYSVVANWRIKELADALRNKDTVNG